MRSSGQVKRGLASMNASRVAVLFASFQLNMKPGEKTMTFSPLSRSKEKRACFVLSKLKSGISPVFKRPVLRLKSSNDPEVNSFFIDGSENKIRYELSLIHRNIIFFLEKVTGEVLSNNLRLTPFNHDDEKLIKILNINVKL